MSFRLTATANKVQRVAGVEESRSLRQAQVRDPSTPLHFAQDDKKKRSRQAFDSTQDNERKKARGDEK